MVKVRSDEVDHLIKPHHSEALTFTFLIPACVTQEFYLFRTFFQLKLFTNFHLPDRKFYLQ